MTAFRILIVDDDREMRGSLVDLMQAAGWETKALTRALDVDRWLDQFGPDVILSDVRMPGMTGIELLASLNGADVPPVVLISAHGDIPMAVEAMQGGAYSFIEKPYEPRRLLTVLSHAADQHRMRRGNARLHARLLQLTALDRMFIGDDPHMIEAKDQISSLADTDTTCLILGETGTGKDLVARALHDLSTRAAGPFIAANAAQFALEHLYPLACAARGGTLFLDEIAACPAEHQAALLRLVEDKELADPATGELHKFDLRILSATNEDLSVATDAGQFRKDLYFRLSAMMIRLPALRVRRDDIVLLTTHFMGQLAQTYDVTVPDMTEDDLAALLAHDWPGNVRELRNVCERRILMARRGVGSMSSAIHIETHGDDDDIPSTLREAVAAFEKQLIAKAIQTHGGRMDTVADALGIGRRTLNEKVVKLGLDKAALL
ncbi:sigma-54 dependent transcriptional regulator [uncultured Tateyamaria sp.]|uniref:sigma-54-dependent transcriptional regulator n=1 Tax=uncultured Tateyamaria sp. TaxID=455651 RepID=UPI0026156A3E|nr:sigma-54 dependent transcriptional regulator [uncultured Tateyamaria sp.]